MAIRFLSLVAAAALILSAPAHAAEINVLSTNALKTVLEDLGPKFEQSSGNKLAITWGTTAQLQVLIEKGAVFDVAVITDDVADDLIKQGKLTSRTALARSGIATTSRERMRLHRAAGRRVRDVRFTPESCRDCRRPARQLRANSGNRRRLFD